MNTVTLSDICSFGATCKFFKKKTCNKKHPCKFFPKCANPSCPYDHVFVQRENAMVTSVLTTPVKSSSHHLKTPDAPTKLTNKLKFSSLNADAPAYVPLFDIGSYPDPIVYYFGDEFDNNSDDNFDDNFDEEVDNDFDNELYSPLSDDNSHILYNGSHYLYKGKVYSSYDEAHDTKFEDNNEFLEISAMITALINELSDEC